MSMTAMRPRAPSPPRVPATRSVREERPVCTVSESPRASSEPLHRRGRQEDRVLPQRVEQVRALGDQRRLEARRPKHVESDDPQRLVPVGKPGFHFERRAGGGNPRQHRETRIERLVETVARPSHRQIGLTREHPRRLGELGDGRRIDQLNGETQRDADGDRDDGQGSTCLALHQRTQDQRAVHAGILGRRRCFGCVTRRGLSRDSG